MDIQFNNLRQEKDTTGIIFCDSNCKLVGYGKKLDQISKKYILNLGWLGQEFQANILVLYQFCVSASQGWFPVSGFQISGFQISGKKTRQSEENPRKI